MSYTTSSESMEKYVVDDEVFRSGDGCPLHMQHISNEG